MGIPSRLLSLLPLIATVVCVGLVKGDVEVISRSNSSALWDGEWMVEFYAPWCGACKRFASTWENFGSWVSQSDVDVRVAKVDVTAEKVLSGQFMVTRLPTVFHFKDGFVREFTNSRDLTTLKKFVEEDEWKNEEPLPWWRSPNAIHMRIFGLLFWLTGQLQDFQVLLTQHYQLPMYMVFVVGALVVIVAGLLFGGGALVCLEVGARLLRKRAKGNLKKKPSMQEKEVEEKERKESKKEDEKKPEVSSGQPRKRLKVKETGEVPQEQ